MTCPGLRILQETEGGGILVEHPVSTTRHALAAPIAELLRVLEEPEDEAVVIESIGTELTEQLQEIGMLVNADAPYEATGRLLRPFEPRFLGVPSGDPGSAPVCVIGMPTDLLSDTGRGAATGPAVLRLGSTPPHYRCDPLSGYPVGWFDYATGRRILEGIRLVDCGDIPFLPGTNVYQAGERLQHVVRGCARAGSLPVVLGGDHSITYWAVAGLAPQAVAVLHLDAHSDLGPCLSDQPTNGSVVRAILGLEHVAALATVGLRGFLPWEETSLRAGHTILSRQQFAAQGSDAVLAALPPELPVYVTLDIDVLDPSLAPATSSPVPGGLGFEELRTLLVRVASERQVIGLDLVEVNGDRDPHFHSARAMTYLALGLLGACFPEQAEEDVA